MPEPASTKERRRGRSTYLAASTLPVRPSALSSAPLSSPVPPPCRSADGKHTLMSALALEVMRVMGSAAGAGGGGAGGGGGGGGGATPGAGGGGGGGGDTVLSDEMGALADPMLKVYNKGGRGGG